jgi:hypothetical protein
MTENKQQEPQRFYTPGDKSFAGERVQFGKSGDIYQVGPGGNLINPRKFKGSKKQRRGKL